MYGTAGCLRMLFLIRGHSACLRRVIFLGLAGSDVHVRFGTRWYGAQARMGGCCRNCLYKAGKRSRTMKCGFVGLGVFFFMVSGA
jgi:hypothetical protein